MNNRITELEISNFKSIKHIKMDCKRINVIIGRPNVGKSNILEALSLYTTQYSQNSKKFLDEYIRYEKTINLFYDQDRKNKISVKSNLGVAALGFHMNNINAYDIIISPDIQALNLMNEPGPETYNLNDKKKNFQETLTNTEHQTKPVKPYYGSISDNDKLTALYSNNDTSYNNPIKKYQFKSLSEYKNHFPSFLTPPYGDNLFTILESNPSLWDECAGLFSTYGLDLLLNSQEEKIFVQKKIGRRVIQIPYALAADTLQRYIFHIAAIESNDNSVLLFEEPESHSFPPYISQLANKIIENANNQFFIATHSPYLLTPFIEQCPPEDIAIFIARYEDYETKIKVLTDEEIQNIMDTGIDLFFNIRAFQE